MIKAKLHSTMGIMAYFGGVLGLLTGFSFISAVEVLYIFVLKPILNFMTRNSSKVSPITITAETKVGFFKNYLQESSIHSLNYIANEPRVIDK